MEILVFFVFLAIIVGVIAFVAQAGTKHHVSKAKACEARVATALNSLNMSSYTTFNNLILRSNGNTSHTEIDHVVVSPYGIFCIETKSHSGLIYGSMHSAYWTQYLGNRNYKLYNPHRQNYKHIKALEDLLGANLRAPIHSYVVFPNAKRVKIDGSDKILSIEHVLRMIANHTNHVYNLPEYEHILKTLAYASSKHDELDAAHQQEVRTYLGSL
jgi:hypothetical protein